ncbi:MAG: hypothetical protein QOH79_3539 [Acidimicrobiaceae bacterium]|jgi:uncharacterized integral membrane protein
MADRDDRNTADERSVSPALIGGIVLALAAIDFVVQNSDRITIHFLFFSFRASTWMALLITSLLAIVATELLSRVIRHNRRTN